MPGRKTGRRFATTKIHTVAKGNRLCTPKPIPFLAEAYFETGQLEQAQTYAYEVLTQEERQPYPYALFTLGRLKVRQGALADAQKHFVEAVRIHRANDDGFIAAYAQHELGSAL